MKSVIGGRVYFWPGKLDWDGAWCYYSLYRNWSITLYVIYKAIDEVVGYLLPRLITVHEKDIVDMAKESGPHSSMAQYKSMQISYSWNRRTNSDSLNMFSVLAM